VTDVKEAVAVDPQLLRLPWELRAAHPELQLSIVDIKTLPYP
jgi:hypothetical protein